MASDPASDILDVVKAKTVLSGALYAGGDWALRFPASDRMKFCAVITGACWIVLEGKKRPLRAETGDVLLLAEKRSFVMCSDVTLRPAGLDALRHDPTRQIARLGTSEEFMQIGGHIELDATSGRLLSAVLAPWVHVKTGSPEAEPLRWILDQLVRERTLPRVGSDVAITQLAQLMFVYLVRSHLRSTGATSVGWARVLADPSLATALRKLHSEPGRDWQLAELARAAGMSRTTFAEKFKSAAGVAPLAYLAQWRTRLAEKALRDTDTTIAALAESLGFSSESAFSHAFKRLNGTSPHRFRLKSRQNPDS
ncbi:MAG: AraC family transcriptional regulator [Archangium sp.]